MQLQLGLLPLVVNYNLSCSNKNTTLKRCATEIRWYKNRTLQMSTTYSDRRMFPRITQRPANIFTQWVMSLDVYRK